MISLTVGTLPFIIILSSINIAGGDITLYFVIFAMSSILWIEASTPDTFNAWVTICIVCLHFGQSIPNIFIFFHTVYLHSIMKLLIIQMELHIPLEH